MVTFEDIARVLKAHKTELRKKYGVIEIGIFGSIVRNEQMESSDIDILVAFENAIDLLTFVNLKNYLTDLLGRNVNIVMSCWHKQIKWADSLGG